MVSAPEQPADKAMMLMRPQPANTAMKALHAIHASRVSIVKICRMRVTTDILANAKAGMSSTRPASNAWKKLAVAGL